MTSTVRYIGSALCVLALLPGCSMDRWDGRMESWGGMRQVMREGHTEARIALSDIVAKPHAFAVGAVEGLRGEILIDDGNCWVGQVVTEQSTQVRHDAKSLRATLLAVAYVPAWSESVLTKAVASDELEAFIRDAAKRIGIDITRPFPFVIEGDFRDLSAHVINGYCPMNQNADIGSAENQPIRFDGVAGNGKLIGIYAEGSAGELTHHGSSIHAHVLTKSSPQIVAHVEGVALAPGAKLRLPAR